MTSTSPRTNADRAPLSRHRILGAAIGIADEQGLDQLSMRKLAGQLGYEVMSLYNHVRNKDDLIDAMVDMVAAEITEPPADADWKQSARAIAISAHEALVRHRWAAGLWSNRWPGPARWRHMEVLLERLADAGFADDLTDLAFHAITLHIEGFTRQQIAYSSMQLDEATMYERFTSEVSRDEYPHMVAHVEYHQAGVRHPDEFAFVLDLILDGLERAAP